MHVEEALRGVPKADRCTCREERAAAKKAAAPGGSWLDKLFAR